MISKKWLTELSGLVGSENVCENVMLSEYTSMKVGGPCDIFVKPRSLKELEQVYRFCLSQKVPVFIMGNGSNLIIRDGGMEGVVIYCHPYLSTVTRVGNVVTAECGILLKDLAAYAHENSLSGLEFASGIPGTLGGAVIMNAGAYDGEMKDVVTRTWYMNSEGEIKVLTGEEHQFGYRKSFIAAQQGLVLKTELELQTDDPVKIKAKMDDLNQRRADKQPLEYPSAGSVFKRPQGYYTGKLIQDCGLKGYSIGGAEVSTKHSGFIINTGNATATNIIQLISYIQKTVRERFGVELETEVKILGRDATGIQSN